MSNQNPQTNVVVLGMHRSGTSLIASFLEASGLWAGHAEDLLDPQADNPKGFWERRDVMALNDALLEEAGGRWYRPVEVSSELACNRIEDARSIVAHLRAPWVLKDPRFLVTWPLWSEVFSSTRCVFVYRNPLAVAESLEKRNGMPLDFGLALWELYNRTALDILRDRPAVAVSYDAYCAHPTAESERLVGALAHLGVPLTGPGENPLEISFNHSPLNDDALRSVLLPSQLELHRQCAEYARGQGFPDLREPPTPGLGRRIESLASAYEKQTWAAEANRQLTEAIGNAEARHEKEARAFQSAMTERDREIDERRHETQSLKKAIEDAQRRHERESKALLARLVEQDESLDEARQAAVRLQEALTTAEEKSIYLFDVLSRHYATLLSFSRSVLGRLIFQINRIYKYATFRPSSTPYEQLLDDARRHLETYEVNALPDTSVRRVSSRLRAGRQMVRYAIRNPHGTLRNLSYERLRRVGGQLVRLSPGDLTQWVEQRFPLGEVERSGMPVLGAELDELALSFPRSERPRVSIVVPVFNQYRMTMNCLRSLLEHTDGIDYEVILGDDASSDLTTTIEERVSGISLVRATANQGFIRNCNASAGAARGEFIIFLNNDTAVTAGWLEPILHLMDTDASIGVVGPKLLFADGQLQEAGGIIWQDASGWNYGRGDDPDKFPYEYVREVDFVSGACLVIRSELWERLGGFDERFVPAYYEDVDVCFGAREAGYKVVYQPHSRVFHFEGVSNGTDLSSGVKQSQARNQVVFREKWAEHLDAEHFPNGSEVFVARDRSRHRRTIVVIDHYVPFYDKDAGSRSTFQYLLLMREEGYNVKFIGANFFPHQPYTAELQRLGIEVLAGEAAAAGVNEWLMANASHIHAIYMIRPHVAEQFLETVGRMRPQPTVLYFGCDLHYLRKRREYALTRERSDLKEAKAWQAREFEIFRQVDHVYYPSQAEVDEIRSVDPDVDVIAIPLYVNPDLPVPEYPGETARDGMLFVGGFNHPPNLDGVNWFIEEVLPLVRQRCPEVTLHVVGSNTPETLLRLEDSGIVVHGFLPDEALEKLYREVSLSVVPLRFGAGIKGKVIEALQHGVPVVTTPIGAEGLPDAESVMLIANDAQTFADEIVKAQSNPEWLCEKLNGYQAYLDQHFSRRRALEILRRDIGSARLD